jgi:hypothetical protein
MSPSSRKPGPRKSWFYRIFAVAFRRLTNGSPGLGAHPPTVSSMKKRHTYLIALVLGFAAVFGAYAALHTAHLGAAGRNAAAAQLARRYHALTAAEARLRKALAQRPAAAKPVVAATAPVAQKVVYVRPAPIVIHKHRAGGENEQEASGGETGD